MSEKTEHKEYWHQFNGGVIFKVEATEECGPVLEINSSFFGNMDTTIRIHTDAKSLLALSEMLKEASEQEFSETYCHAAITTKGAEHGGAGQTSRRPHE